MVGSLCIWNTRESRAAVAFVFSKSLPALLLQILSRGCPAAAIPANPGNSVSSLRGLQDSSCHTENMKQPQQVCFQAVASRYCRLKCCQRQLRANSFVFLAKTTSKGRSATQDLVCSASAREPTVHISFSSSNK